MSISSPESDSSEGKSDPAFDTSKKLSPGEIHLEDEVSDSKNFIKEKSQNLHEKDLDEASNSSSLSRVKAVPTVATLICVNDKLFSVIFPSLNTLTSDFREAIRQL